MRIRTVKPEFWRSLDTADLDMFTRLLFIGLWNYVDDNGVGEDDVHLIRSDLFPRDRNVDELSQLIHGSLTELSSRGQITRYRDRETGRRYLHVVAWHHQRINRPTDSKKPLPTSDNCETTEDSSTAHGVLTEDSLLYQGSKGAREQGIPPYPPAAETPPTYTRKTGADLVRSNISKLPARSPAAHQIAQAFSDSLPSPIPSKVLAEMGSEIDQCLTDGISPQAIANGMRDWAASDSWSPTQIPRFIAKAAARPNVVGKPTRKALDYADAAEALIAELETTA